MLSPEASSSGRRPAIMLSGPGGDACQPCILGTLPAPLCHGNLGSSKLVLTFFNWKPSVSLHVYVCILIVPLSLSSLVSVPEANATVEEWWGTGADHSSDR